MKSQLDTFRADHAPKHKPFHSRQRETKSYIKGTLRAILCLFIARTTPQEQLSPTQSAAYFTMTSNPTATYPITGIQDGLPPSGSPLREVPLRVEVDDFYTLNEYAIQRNLFLLAMAKFEKMDPSEKLSYFQVAGAVEYTFNAFSQLTRASRYPRHAA